MAPFAFAVSPAVLVTLISIAFFALTGFALLKLRTSMVASRPIDIEAPLTQIQTQLVPVVGRLGFNAPQMALRDTMGRLIRVRAGVDPNAGSEAMLLARPESLYIEQPLKVVRESSLVASSSFEAWASSLCDLIEDFTGLERTSKISSSEPGLVPSSSFEVWAANLCDLLSDFASPRPYRSGFTPLLDTFEDDPYIFDTMYEETVVVSDVTIPDIMVTPPSPRLEDTDQLLFEPGLVASPSLADLATECVEEHDYEATFVIEDDVETEDDMPSILADELLDESAQYTQNEPTLSLSFRYDSILSTEIQTKTSELDNEERISDYTPQYNQSQSSQYLSPLSALSLPPVVEEPIVECEPEETLKSVFESDSEDDETYYSRRPHLSQPKRASQSMSSMLRTIVEKRKAQQSRRKESKNDKENEDRKKHSRASKRRLFSKTLATPSEPRNLIIVPTIRFTPPTPPRKFTKRENEGVGSDSERNEVVERVAFDLVVDDHGHCFF